MTSTDVSVVVDNIINYYNNNLLVDKDEILERLKVVLNKEELMQEDYIVNEGSFYNLLNFINKYGLFEKDKFSIGINDFGRATALRNFNGLYIHITFLSNNDVIYYYKNNIESKTREKTDINNLIKFLTNPPFQNK
jgi:hypothetical protein